MTDITKAALVAALEKATGEIRDEDAVVVRYLPLPAQFIDHTRKAMNEAVKTERERCLQIEEECFRNADYSSGSAYAKGQENAASAIAAAIEEADDV